MSVLRAISYIVLLLVSASPQAAIVVTPSSPVSGNSVRIAVVNQYFSDARITSATISRNGDQFLIAQVVDVNCSLPSAPILTSTFDFASLPTGTYHVMAQIQHTVSLPIPGCPEFTATQSSSFVVRDPAAVPVGDTLTYFAVSTLLVLVLAHFANGNAREA